MDQFPAKFGRRSFLTAAAASTAAGILSPAVLAADPMRSHGRPAPAGTAFDVIVVGAGFAGITAARDLSKAGLKVLLIEARNRIGGRTFTSTYRGKRIEMGGTWIHWSQPFVWAEVSRYALGLEESPGAAADTVSWITADTLKTGSADETWSRVGDAMAKFCDVDGAGGRLVMPRAHDPLFASDLVAKQDTFSLQDRLDQIRLPREEEDLLAVQLTINCHNHPREGGLADMLRWWSLGDFDMGRMFDKLGRYEIREGMGALASAMLRDSSADVLLGTPVRSIEQAGNQVAIATAAGKVFTARATVLAVPLNVLDKIQITPALSAGKQAMALAGHTGHGTKCYVHVKQKIGKWVGMAPSPSPITLAWTEQERDDGTLVVTFGPPGLLDITDEEAVQAAMRRLLPGAQVLGVTGYQWEADPYARGTWCWYRPNQLTAGLKELQRSEDRVFLAGSDMANGWRGFVDGAIECGVTAAARVRQAIDH